MSGVREKQPSCWRWSRFRMGRKRTGPGFTLIELAIVIVVVSLLLGGMLAPLAAQLDLRKTNETRRLLEEVREALLGYAAGHGHLPCPDRFADGDGLADPRSPEDPPEEGCADAQYEGWVPRATLGVSGMDGWGQRLRYRVSREFTRARGDPGAAACGAGASGNPCTLELGDPGELFVYTRDLVDRGERLAAREVAAVVLSPGANGHGSVGPGGSVPVPPPAGARDERANLDGDRHFFSRERTPPAAGCDDGRADAPPCDFDDLLVWIAPPVLYHRLVSAGRLP